MQKQYAEAIDRMVSKGGSEQELGDNLMRHLKDSGRLKLLPGILRELKAREARKQKLAPVIEVADQGEADAARKGAAAAGIATDNVVVNDSLISGWRARSGSSLVDRSGRTALIEIYRNIVRK